MIIIGIVERLKQSRGAHYYGRYRGWQEERAEKRQRELPKKIERMKRETEFLRARAARDKARQRSPSALKSFLTGPPSMGFGGAFGFEPPRRRKTRRKKRSSKVIMIRV